MLCNAAAASWFVDSVFQVCDIAGRLKGQGSDHFFIMTLTDGTDLFEAIACKAAASIGLGEVVKVGGCLLIRCGHPILVVCALKPATRVGRRLIRFFVPVFPDCK